MENAKWIETLKQDHPGSTLSLCTEELTKAQFAAIKDVIKSGQYTHIELANSKPTNAMLRDWIDAVRDNDKITQIVYNQKGLDTKLTGELQSMLNANRAMNKIFGKGRLLFARSVPMFGIVGFNFIQGIATVVAPIHAQAAAIIGGLVLASLRAASNYWFSRSLHQTKAKDYWNNQSSLQAYDLGKNCAKSWSPWFHGRSWISSDAYLGYAQEKHKMAYTAESQPRPKPRT